MAFMISRETENVKSSEEIESAFRALSAENKPYVTKEELYQVRNTHLLLLWHVGYVYVREINPHGGARHVTFLNLRLLLGTFLLYLYI